MRIKSRRASALLVGALLGCLALSGCGDGSSDSRPGFDPLLEDHDQHAVSHILIRVDKDRTPPAARELAFEVYAQLRGGTAFADLAAQYSDHHSRRDGGFIGFVQTYPKTRFAAVVAAFEPGMVSRPIVTDLGYQIIKRHSYAEGKRLEADKWYAVNGFLIPWKGEKGGVLEKPAALAAAQAALARLRSGKSTLVVERERNAPGTEDPERSAFLFMTPIQKQYEDVLSAIMPLRPGQYSDIVELAKGYAVLQRGTLLRAIVRHILISDTQAPDRPKHVKRAPNASRELVGQALKALEGSPARWLEVLKKYTDDDVRERPGGLLGVVKNGDLPVPLEQAIVDTPVGQVNPRAIRSARGWHILYRER